MLMSNEKKDRKKIHQILLDEYADGDKMCIYCHGKLDQKHVLQLKFELLNLVNVPYEFRFLHEGAILNALHTLETKIDFQPNINSSPYLLYILNLIMKPCLFLATQLHIEKLDDLTNLYIMISVLFILMQSHGVHFSEIKKINNLLPNKKNFNKIVMMFKNKYPINVNTSTQNLLELIVSVLHTEILLHQSNFDIKKPSIVSMISEYESIMIKGDLSKSKIDELDNLLISKRVPLKEPQIMLKSLNKEEHNKNQKKFNIEPEITLVRISCHKEPKEKIVPPSEKEEDSFHESFTPTYQRFISVERFLTSYLFPSPNSEALKEISRIQFSELRSLAQEFKRLAIEASLKHRLLELPSFNFIDEFSAYNLNNICTFLNCFAEIYFQIFDSAPKIHIQIIGEINLLLKETITKPNIEIKSDDSVDNSLFNSVISEVSFLPEDSEDFDAQEIILQSENFGNEND